MQGIAQGSGDGLLALAFEGGQGVRQRRKR